MPNFPQRQPRNPPVASNYVRLEGSERRPARKAQLLGAADAHELVKFTIVLRRRPDGPPVPDFDHFAKTPPSQRRRLAAAEFAALYGAHPNEIAQIVNFVQSHGMSVVETHPGRRIVVATGTVAQISEAFVVTLGRYQRDRRSYQRDFKSTRGGRPQIETYRGRDGFIQVPKNLAGIIVGVFGLDNRRVTGVNGNQGDPTNIGAVTIQTVTQLYNFPAPASTIGGQTIGILSPGGGFGGYFQSDLQQFFGAALPSVTPVAVDAGNGAIEAQTTLPTTAGQNTLTFAPTTGITVGSDIVVGPYSNQVGGISPNAAVMGVTTTASATTVTVGIYDYSTSTWSPAPASALVPAGTTVYFNLNDETIETTQDICISASAAPGANVGVYFSTDDQAGWVDMISRAIHPDPDDYPLGVKPPSVLSSSFYISGGDDPYALASWNISEGLINAVHAAFEDAAIQGVTVCIASGDYGSNCLVGKYIESYDQSTNTYTYGGDGNAHVQYPASDPWVLSVGGTALGGNVAGSPPPWVEFVWNDPDAGPPIVEWGTTGGGVSAFFPQPSYQANANVPNSINLTADPGYPPFNTTGRGVPDVAANASYNSGYLGLYFAGSDNWYYGNGTSAAAPLWAGLIAVINSNLGFNVGFVNPTLYALGSSVFNAINALNPALPQLAGCPTNNSNSGIAGYQAGAGWDACTGWGSPNGQELLAALQAGSEKDCFLILDWSTFTQQGVAEMLAQPSTNPAVFQPAFYVVADWFTPADLGIGTATPVVPQFTFSPYQPSGMTIQPIGGAEPDGTPTVPNAPQRFTFTYQATFTDTTGFPTAAQEIEPITISASVTGAISGVTVTGSAVVDLTTQSAPFMVAGATSWLSNDIRVFQVQPGDSLAGLPSVVMGNSGNAPNDAATFIQEVVQGFNQLAASEPPPSHPFDSISTNETASELDILQTTSGGVPVFNFAVARVRYQDPLEDAENVRVFFRTFPALAVSTAYDQTTTYRRWSDGVEFGDTIPLLGSQYDSSLGMQLETIPFFAQPRIDTTAASMDMQTDQTNVQTLVHDPTDATVYAYYGCWLDINQPSQLPFPQTPTGDGPFTGTASNPLVSILSLLGNQHQCITAEIAFDPDPIAPGSVPGISTLLGQRNLTLGPVANPGHAASRTIPNPFELRPTQLKRPDNAPPDELMLDWGSLPAGSTATLYLPAASAAGIITQANALYGMHKLKQIDDHTIQFPVAGITYIPVPVGEANLAALLSVELPLGIRKGQLFTALARQVTTVFGASRDPVINKQPANAAVGQGTAIEWKRVLGSFQLAIPVEVKAEMLEPDERLLSLLRWLIGTVANRSRWLPVLQRYVNQVAARVQALGGNPTLVLPSPQGNWQGSEPPKPVSEHLGFTGKVAGLIFDRFGDFESFLLETEHGDERSFNSREYEIEEIVRDAWRDRTLITVFVTRKEPHRPVSILLRRTVRPVA